jgi:hypothetical protein
MRRLALLIGLAVVLSVASWLGWRWWMAPPLQPAATLAAEAARLPEAVDGAVIVGEPGKAIRWLFRHPQAGALVGVASGEARRRADTLRGGTLAMARDARGPLRLWWRGRELAVAATVGAGTRDGMREVAAMGSLAFAASPAGDGAGEVALATSADLLRGSSAPPGPAPDGRWSAVAFLGGRWWWVRAERDRLEAVTGVPPATPELVGRSVVTSTDVHALLAALSPSLDHHAPARLLVDEHGDWAVALPATHASRTAERLLAAAGITTAPVGDGTAFASTSALLPALAGPVRGDEGAVRGGDLAALARRVAGAEVVLVVTGADADDLRRAADLLDGLRAARWRVTPAGGRVVLEW